MHTQPYVLRLSFKGEPEVIKAHAELENMGVFGDYNKSGSKWQLIFTDKSLNIAKSTIRRLATKPYFVDVFDAHDVPAEGWPQFKSLADS